MRVDVTADVDGANAVRDGESGDEVFTCVGGTKGSTNRFTYVQ
ncbi:hypothetical protein GFS60_01889 [Rhodococcus sp. WAY2]|nr:hypothetical protein GFS60_01889 [Rhodococcus sp. WAY2]